MTLRDQEAGGNGNGQNPFKSFGAPPFTDMWNLTTESMGAWNTASLRAWQACGKEWFTFLSNRLAEDAVLPKRLGSCNSPQEVWSTYAAYWQKAFEDYQQEFSRLAEMTSASFTAAQESVNQGKSLRPQRPGLRPD